jgi:predicted nucleic acid-binding protein
MRHYADSSFLVSCYIRDANTAAARTYLTRAAAPLALTALHALEVRNAFQLGIFRKLLTVTEAAEAWTNLQADLRAGRLLRANVKWPPVFRFASHLSEKHSATDGTRSLDIIHVASARIMQAIEFVSFDARQRALASAIGLKVAP